MPWLAPEGERAVPEFWAQVAGSLVVGLILAFGQWWLRGGSPAADIRRAARTRILVVASVLIAAVAAGIAVIMEPFALVFVLGFFGVVGAGWLLSRRRRRKLRPKDVYLGIYSLCLMSLVASAATVSRALAPAL